MNERICEVLKNNDWKEINFKDLKTNDIFRLFDPIRVPVKDNDGSTKFVAMCDAYQDENGTWTTEV